MSLPDSGGPILVVGPPLPIDDPADVRYSVHRRGRVVMAGTAPSADEAHRLAFGERVTFQLLEPQGSASRFFDEAAEAIDREVAIALLGGAR